MEYSFGGIFIAGCFSFFTPCVLPLLPAYTALLFGTGNSCSNLRGLLNSFAFLSGFCLVFVAMGATVGVLADLFWEYKEVIRKIGAGFIGLMGLYMLGGLRIKVFDREKRPFLNRTFEGPLGAFTFGMAFTIGWTPCVGPILGSVLAYAGTEGTGSRGSLLLLTYALGFCIPFIIMAALTKKYMAKVRGFYVYLPLIQRISGLIMIVMGIVLYMDWLKKLNLG